MKTGNSIKKFYIKFSSGVSAYCPKNDSQYYINTSEDGKLKDCNDGTQVCRDGVNVFFCLILFSFASSLKIKSLFLSFGQ